MSEVKMRFHHLGLPTAHPREGEVFLPDFGMHVTPLQENPFRIQWMRFEEDSPLPRLVMELPHLAFQVDSLEAALAGREILISPNSPSEGVRVAFVVHEGAPIEFLEFTADHPDRLSGGEGRESNHA